MIDVSERDGIAVVTLNHGKANALDVEFCEAIADRFDDLSKRPARAIILTGTGRIFSAGVDLLRISAEGTAYVQRFLPALHRMFDTVFNCPKPVIAAVNGHAIAGGCVLACCADRRIASRDAGRVGVTEILVGVPFPAMAFEVMRFAATSQSFPDVILSGATYLSDEAKTRGLIDEVVAPAELMDRALATARTLAALPSATFALTKQQIRQPVTDRMAQHGANVDASVSRIWNAADTLTHIRDYVASTFKKA
jgi:enoyl-CoA hydratase